MKKAFLTLLALTAIFALTGCSKDSNPTAVYGGNGPVRDDAFGPEAAADPVLKAVKAMNADLGDFDTLLAGLKAESLVMPLVKYGKATTFAPTDDAFAALGLDETNIAELPGLYDILTYHVVAEKLFAADVLAVSSITMANGQVTEISLRDGAPYINDSMITMTDYQAPTGVVHIIDAVLLP